MGAVSTKNELLGGAVGALGLGDLLAQQLDQQEEERKKKLLGRPGSDTDNPLSGLGAATKTLFGGITGGSNQRMNLGL